jgi:transposase InsO family protein
MEPQALIRSRASLRRPQILARCATGPFHFPLPSAATLFRLYREEKLAVRRRGGRKRAIGTRAPMLVPMAPNDRWSLDFVSDQLTDCRRFRILTIVDDATRECVAAIPDVAEPLLD